MVHTSYFIDQSSSELIDRYVLSVGLQLIDESSVGLADSYSLTKAGPAAPADLSSYLYALVPLIMSAAALSLVAALIREVRGRRHERP